MTTSQIIAHIRIGIRLIKNAMCEEQMKFNHAYSLGQVNLALHNGDIGDQDWKDLNEEIKLSVNGYKDAHK